MDDATQKLVDELRAEIEDIRGGYTASTAALDRFRDVVCEVTGYGDENPGDDVVIAKLREMHDKIGPEPTRWRDFMVGANAARDQILAHHAADALEAVQRPFPVDGAPMGGHPSEVVRDAVQPVTPDRESVGRWLFETFGGFRDPWDATYMEKVRAVYLTHADALLPLLGQPRADDVPSAPSDTETSGELAAAAARLEALSPRLTYLQEHQLVADIQLLLNAVRATRPAPPKKGTIT